MSSDMIALLTKSLYETMYMVIASTILATLIGLPLGIILTVTDKGQILENKGINSILGAIVNATRSTPFIILMVAIIPFTRLIVGSSIGTTAAIVPLTISAAPFIARIIESSLLEVDPGVIEASQSMGASPMQIITKVFLPEAMHSIVLGITLAIISLIGYSAMAGALGGGGLGRPCHSLWLSTFPFGYYDYYCYYFDCSSANRTIPWKLHFCQAKQDKNKLTEMRSIIMKKLSVLALICALFALSGCGAGARS